MKSLLRQTVLSLIVLSFTLPSFAEKATEPAHAAVASAAQSTTVDINTADVETFINAHIKGIGKKRATDIVAYRQEHGPFKTVEDLKNVKGISEKLIDDNKTRLTMQ